MINAQALPVGGRNESRKTYSDQPCQSRFPKKKATPMRTWIFPKNIRPKTVMFAYLRQQTTATLMVDASFGMVFLAGKQNVDREVNNDTSYGYI